MWFSNTNNTITIITSGQLDSVNFHVYLCLLCSKLIEEKKQEISKLGNSSENKNWTITSGKGLVEKEKKHKNFWWFNNNGS